jgi:hypothetical protein
METKISVPLHGPNPLIYDVIKIPNTAFSLKHIPHCIL